MLPVALAVLLSGCSLTQGLAVQKFGFEKAELGAEREGHRAELGAERAETRVRMDSAGSLEMLDHAEHAGERAQTRARADSAGSLEMASEVVATSARSQMRLDGDPVEEISTREMELMGQMMDPQHQTCPNSSDADTLATLNRTLYRWRDKTITIAGDSLTDHPYEALVCSAILLGAKLTVLPGYAWPRGGNWVNPNTDEPAFRPIPNSASRPIRMNQLVFDNWGGPLGRGSKITIRQIRFFDYDNAGFVLSAIFEPEADLLLVNLAHEAYHANIPKPTKDVTYDIIKKAAARDVFDKLVLFGHPPQHFDTETGQYISKKQALSGQCRCRDESAMKGQASWITNNIMSEIARAHRVPYVEPWPYYAQACNDHLDDHDCTHFTGEFSLHAKFVEQLLRAGERSQ